MSRITKKEFISLLRQAVIFYPNDKEANECLRLQTFILLKHRNQYKADNFGITSKDKDFYFNRMGGVEIKYPALFIWEQGFQEDGFYNTMNRPSKQCSTFEVTVIDRLIDDCKKCDYCEKRSGHQIQCDTHEMLRNVMYYFKGVISADVVDNDNVTTTIFANQSILGQMIGSDSILSYEVNERDTTRFQKSLDENNPIIQGNYYRSLTQKGLYGTFQIMKFCFPTCEPCDFTFEEKNYTNEILNCCK